MIRTSMLALSVLGCGSPPAPIAPQRAALQLTAAGLEGVDLAAPVSFTAVRDRVPGYAASETVEYFESSPDSPVPTFCFVRRGGACDLVMFPGAGGITRIRVLDPAVLAPGGVGVGRAYRAVAAALGPCQVIDGVERGMTCAVRGVPNIEAWFTLGDDVTLAGETPTPEILDRATVTHLWWWLPGT